MSNQVVLGTSGALVLAEEALQSARFEVTSYTVGRFSELSYIVTFVEVGE